MKRALAICCHAEHWPKDMQACYAAQMAETGIARVRVGESAGARPEPAPGPSGLVWPGSTWVCEPGASAQWQPT